MDPPGQINETNATNGYPPGRYFRGNLHHSVRCKMIRNNDQLEICSSHPANNRRFIRLRFDSLRVLRHVGALLLENASGKEIHMERITICSDLLWSACHQNEY